MNDRNARHGSQGTSYGPARTAAAPAAPVTTEAVASRDAASDAAADEAADAAPTVPAHETAEFKAAVAEAAREAVEAAMKAVADRVPAAASPTDPTGVLAGLSLALAELNDQSSGQKRVAPAEMRRRTEAHARMMSLIQEARYEGRAAMYQLTAKVYIDETMIDPLWLDAAKRSQATSIEYDGVPNDTFVPVNDTARAIHAAYLESIGEAVKVVEQHAAYITPRGVVINGVGPGPPRHDGPR